MRRRRAALVLALAVMAALPARAGDLRPFGRGAWTAILAAHRGQPLAVHFWSLTCAPCLGELPQWRQVLREGRVAVVLVATDPIEDAPRLRAMLKRHGLDGAENWAFADPFTDRLRFEVDRRWHGELPLTRLIDAIGTAESHVGTFAGTTLRNRIEALGQGRR